MLAELVGWYAGQEQNRRRYPRVRKEYAAKYSINNGHTWHPVQGVDLGGGGLCVNSERLIPPVVVDVVMTLGDKEVRLKAHSVWNTELESHGKRLHCHGLQFTSIAADTWDVIMHWITGSETLEYAQTPSLRIAETEISHFLPRDLRKRMLDELTKIHRYDPKGVDQPQFDYAGVGVVSGKPMHRFTVHTKVRAVAQEMRYTTRLVCDDEGTTVQVLN
jgi:hypothetical protein